MCLLNNSVPNKQVNMNLPHSFNICPCSIYPTAKTTRVIKCYNRKLQARKRKISVPTTLLNSNFCFKTYASIIIGITKVKYTIKKEICKLSFDSNKSKWVFAFAFWFFTACENVGCVLTCYVRISMGWLHPLLQRTVLFMERKNISILWLLFKKR